MKQDTEHIKKDIRTFIIERFLINSKNEILDDTPLISGGLIDSIQYSICSLGIKKICN